MIDSRVAGEGSTTVFTAKMRELESSSASPQVVDQFAAAFVEASGMDLSMVSLSAMTGQRLFESNVVRTWWLDQKVRAAISAGCMQVVILDAGLDSRAFRLDADARFFEVSAPAIADFKREILGRLGVIHADDAGRWTQVTAPAREYALWSKELVAAGFDVHSQTCWVGEGLFYLDEHECSAVLEIAAKMSGTGSEFLASHFGQGSLEEAQTKEMSAAAEDKSGRGFASIVTDPRSWLSTAGWTLDEAATIAEVGRSIGREVRYSADETEGHEYTWLIKGSV